MQDQLDSPFLVPAHVDRVRLVVMNDGDQVPNAVPIFMSTAPDRFGLRFAGGCSGMTDAQKLQMLEYFPAGLRYFRGLVASGGNRGVNADGSINIMVTDVPAALVAANPDNVLAVSTLPRTGDLGIVAESRLTLDDSNRYGLNPGVHMVILVQDRAGFAMDWDGDLDVYFQLYDLMVRQGKWKFGMVAFNGGSITKVEVLRAVLLGWPVFLITGSGRVTDELAEQVQQGVIDVPDALKARGVTSDSFVREQFALVPFDDPNALDRAMEHRGLIVPS